MGHFRNTAFCALLAAAHPAIALADLTSDSFWAHWEPELAAPDSGIKIGAVERAGKTVILRDVTIGRADTPQSAIGPIPQIILSDVDGGIEITLSQEVPFHSATAQEVLVDGVLVEQLRETAGRILAPGAKVRLSGNAPDDLTAADLDAPDVQAILDSETRAGNPVDSDLTLNLTGAKARYSYGPKGSDHSLALSASVASVAVKGRKADPAIFQGEFTIDGAFDAPAFDFVMTMPKDFLFDETVWDSEKLPPGAVIRGGYESGASTLNLDIPGKLNVGQDTVGAGEMVLSLAAQSTKLSGDMSGAEFAVLADIRAAGMALSGPGAPIPLEGQFAELFTDIRLPIAKSDTSTDFRWINRITDLRLPDTMWDQADPGKRLPRDPLSLELDLTGKGRSTYDWMTRPPGEEMADPPMLVDWLKLNTLRVSGAGAELTGSGEATFDNNAGPATIPVPAGKLNLRLTGGNALLENVVGMGLLKDDEVMGLRLFSGMIFKAGEGEDVMISDIEANEEGQVIVNGMRVR